MAVNVNTVVVSGNLTRDPELRTLNSGTSVAKMRIAVNSRRKNQSGEWEDKPNYFSVSVFGKQGENCATYLSKGRACVVQGRLDWHEWETDGNKREAVEIIADTVAFMGEAPKNVGGANGGSDVPIDESDFESAAPAASGTVRDDIPF